MKEPISAKVDNKGRLALPLDLRKRLHIEPGDVFFIEPEKNDILRLARAENPFDILAKQAIEDSKAGKTVSLEKLERQMKARKDGNQVIKKTKKTKISSKPGLSHKAPKPPEKTIRVHLWLEVENNNKFVRGRKRAKEAIEDHCLQFYNFRKLDKEGWEYELTIPYENDEDLDKTIYQLISDIDSTADMYHCCIECDLYAIDDPDRTW